MDSPQSYIDALPDGRREAIATVRSVILENLPHGYEEVIAFGMISYQVPLSIKSDTYNGKPLQYAALASQKNHMAVYLSAIYTDPEAAADFEKKYKATGKRLDVGKSCVRFKRLDDLPLDLIGEAIASYDVSEFVMGRN
jgi:hypothetical protein